MIKVLVCRMPAMLVIISLWTATREWGKQIKHPHSDLWGVFYEHSDEILVFNSSNNNSTFDSPCCHKDGQEGDCFANQFLPNKPHDTYTVFAIFTYKINDETSAGALQYRFWSEWLRESSQERDNSSSWWLMSHPSKHLDEKVNPWKRTLQSAGKTSH